MVTLLSISLYGQYYYSPNTYYVTPPTSGCNGVWAVDGSVLSSGTCSPPYTYTISPAGCANYDYNNGDTLFFDLCSFPCSYSMISFSSSIPCFNCEVSISSDTFPSFCTAPDSIVANYKEDAGRLALRRVYRMNTTYTDSINIPGTWSDTVLNALIAVYNATSLPARDTVITMYDIHTFPYPEIRTVSVSADSNLSWMQQLRNNVIPTGNFSVDSIINKYYLNPYYYHTWFYMFSHQTAELQSDSNLNIQILANHFEVIPGVYFAEPITHIGDGNNITDSVYPDFVELIYSFGWGDCYSGCISRRYWKFHVFPDCSVTFNGSWGTPLPLSSVTVNNNKEFNIYPNPTSGKITICSKGNISSIVVRNILGGIVFKKVFSVPESIQTEISEINISSQPKGFYFITIDDGVKTYTKKIIKLN